MGSAGGCCQEAKSKITTDELSVPKNGASVVLPQQTNEGAARSQPRVGPRHERIGAGIDALDAEEQHLQAHMVKGKRPTQQTKDLVEKGLQQNRVCADFTSDDLELIFETLHYYEFQAGQTVVKQGDAGTHFFVVEKGMLEVTVNGRTVNTLEQGHGFGALALLYNTGRTASVLAKGKASVWGASGDSFKKAMQDSCQKHAGENVQRLNSIGLFEGVSSKQKSLIAESMFVDSFEPGARVVTEDESATAIYFVASGTVDAMSGAAITKDGKVVGGTKVATLGAGEVFGEGEALYNETYKSTLVARTKSEIVALGIEHLKTVLGDDLAVRLEQGLIFRGFNGSNVLSQFSQQQQRKFLELMETKSLAASEKVDSTYRFVVILDGSVTSVKSNKTLGRGKWFEDTRTMSAHEAPSEKRAPAEEALLEDGVVGPDGARLKILTKDGLAKAFQDLGANEESAVDIARKLLLVKKVSIFRHLAEQHCSDLAKVLTMSEHPKGSAVIKQGDIGKELFVVAKGEVEVFIGDNSKPVRTMYKNAYFGERALLFDEPRTATIKVASKTAEFWSIDQAKFAAIVTSKMQDEMKQRIGLQDTSVSMKDLRHVKIIGAGGCGVVRLVEHVKTGMRYALKRVRKKNGGIPEEVTRECALLAGMDHPFVMLFVKTFETQSSVYMLTEVITGGELYAAIRKIPNLLSREQAQFYTGSLVLVLESLQDRNIVYRDLKPENVMLDAQGFLKLIDFGISKKLSEAQTRTFTMVGTPHYMAPEVVRGRGYGTECDLWSLGVILYEFVCGSLPFAEELEDPSEVLDVVMKAKLSFPKRYSDEAGQNLMVGLMTKKQEKRFGVCGNGYEDLKKHKYFRPGKPAQGPEVLFQKIMGRALDPPLVPAGEEYADPDEVNEADLSDYGELATNKTKSTTAKKPGSKLFGSVTPKRK